MVEMVETMLKLHGDGSRLTAHSLQPADWQLVILSLVIDWSLGLGHWSFLSSLGG
jgi:hypothetical protein